TALHLRFAHPTGVLFRSRGPTVGPRGDRGWPSLSSLPHARIRLPCSAMGREVAWMQGRTLPPATLPSMRTFASPAEFTGAIDTALEERVSDTELRAAIVAGIQTGELDARDDAALHDGGLSLRVNSFVLRDRDLPMTELIGV